MFVTPLAAIPPAVYYRAALVLALIAGALGLYAWGLNHKAASAKAHAETAQYRAAYEVLAAKVAEQNAAILRMEADAEAARQSAAKALEEAQRKNAPRKQASAKLRSTRAKACPDAVAAVRKTLR